MLCSSAVGVELQSAHIWPLQHQTHHMLLESVFAHSWSLAAIVKQADDSQTCLVFYGSSQTGVYNCYNNCVIWVAASWACMRRPNGTNIARYLIAAMNVLTPPIHVCTMAHGHVCVSRCVFACLAACLSVHFCIGFAVCNLFVCVISWQDCCRSHCGNLNRGIRRAT